MQRIIATSLAALLMVVMGALEATAAPEQVDPGCFPDRVCLWDGEQYSGDVVSITIPAVGVCINVQDWMNNRASSIFNNSPYYLAWYDEPNCGEYINTAWPWLKASSMPGSTDNLYTSMRRI